MNFDSSVLNVAVEDIIPNRSQPRLAFDDASLSDLAKSIKEHGIIQPLVLRKFGDKYEIVAGERRYKAAQLAGLASVPAVVALIDDKTSAEVAIAENVQRKPLTAIEEAKSYKALLDLGYMSQEQLAGKMGISVSSLRSKLALLNLSPEIQDGIMESKISERHARSLLMIPDSDGQLEWFHKTIDNRLTVRQLDEEIKKIYGEGGNNMNMDFNAIKQNAQDITPMQPVQVQSAPSYDFTTSIDLGQKTNGRFFNSFENNPVSMDMTEAINPLTMNDNTPNLGFGAPSSGGLSFAAVDTSSPAPSLDAPTFQDPTVLPSIPQAPGLTVATVPTPGDSMPAGGIDSLESLDFMPPQQGSVDMNSSIPGFTPAVTNEMNNMMDMTPASEPAPMMINPFDNNFNAAPVSTPAPMEQVPAMSAEPMALASEPLAQTISPEEAKNKINNLVQELKAAGYNIDMTTADMGDQTLFNIILKK